MATECAEIELAGVREAGRSINADHHRPARERRAQEQNKKRRERLIGLGM
jgi:hypothetical protein